MKSEREITSISKAAWTSFWKGFKAKGVYALFIILLWDFLVIKFFQPGDIGAYLIIAPWTIFIWWLAAEYAEAKTAFWKQFAGRNGYEYTENREVDGERALLFKEGEGKNAEHSISGTYEGLPFQIFEYTYSTGSGKHKSYHYFTIFEFRFKGVFPHLYLNNTTDNHDISLGKRMSMPEIDLPGDLVKKFKLYVPREYEIEALHIFSLDTLAHLLDIGWKHDLELVDSELLIFRPKHFNTSQDLEEEFSTIKKFVDHLAPKLNRATFTPIGDYSPTL